MRLTPEVMARSQSHMNALKQRELELRGLQIPLIENLASHQGSYDVLNLTDNSLLVLGNVPFSPRIRSIHVGNNSISSIAQSFAGSVPFLETLNLAQNNLPSLSSLLPLSACQNLIHLVINGNPVCGERYVREFLIWKIPSLRTIDFKRIKDAERSAALDLFVDSESKIPTKLGLEVMSEGPGGGAGGAGAGGWGANGKSKDASAANGQANGGGNGKGKGKGRLMTEEDKKKVRESILGAGSVEEMKRLERMLAEGRVPEGVSVGGGGAEDVGEGEEVAGGDGAV